MEAREEPPLIETYICVQIRQCRDDDDPGEIAEGWFSVDGSAVTVTNASGEARWQPRHAGGRESTCGCEAAAPGEDPGDREL